MAVQSDRAKVDDHPRPWAVRAQLERHPWEVWVEDARGKRVPIDCRAADLRVLTALVEVYNRAPQLDKALEACRLMEAARRLECKAREYQDKSETAMMVRCYRCGIRAVEKAAALAREALEMPEGRNDIGGPERV